MRASQIGKHATRSADVVQYLTSAEFEARLEELQSTLAHSLQMGFQSTMQSFGQTLDNQLRNCLQRIDHIEAVASSWAYVPSSEDKKGFLNISLAESLGILDTKLTAAPAAEGAAAVDVAAQAVPDGARVGQGASCFAACSTPSTPHVLAADGSSHTDIDADDDNDENVRKLRAYGLSEHEIADILEEYAEVQATQRVQPAGPSEQIGIGTEQRAEPDGPSVPVADGSSHIDIDADHEDVKNVRKLRAYGLSEQEIANVLEEYAEVKETQRTEPDGPSAQIGIGTDQRTEPDGSSARIGTGTELSAAPLGSTFTKSGRGGPYEVSNGQSHPTYVYLTKEDVHWMRLVSQAHYDAVGAAEHGWPSHLSPS